LKDWKKLESEKKLKDMKGFTLINKTILNLYSEEKSDLIETGQTDEYSSV
jgi:hypothetical protein